MRYWDPNLLALEGVRFKCLMQWVGTAAALLDAPQENGLRQGGIKVPLSSAEQRDWMAWDRENHALGGSTVRMLWGHVRQGFTIFGSRAAAWGGIEGCLIRSLSGL